MMEQHEDEEGSRGGSKACWSRQAEQPEILKWSEVLVEQEMHESICSKHAMNMQDWRCPKYHLSALFAVPPRTTQDGREGL